MFLSSRVLISKNALFVPSLYPVPISPGTCIPLHTYTSLIVVFNYYGHHYYYHHWLEIVVAFNLPVTVLQLDTEIGQYLRQHVPEVSPGRTRESEIDSTLSQELTFSECWESQGRPTD